MSMSAFMDERSLCLVGVFSEYCDTLLISRHYLRVQARVYPRPRLRQRLHLPGAALRGEAGPVRPLALWSGGCLHCQLRRWVVTLANGIKSFEYLIPLNCPHLAAWQDGHICKIFSKNQFPLCKYKVAFSMTTSHHLHPIKNIQMKVFHN